MTKKNGIALPESHATREELEAIEKTEERTTEQPNELRLNQIHVADQAFQPRWIDENPLASTDHIKELKRVLEAQRVPFDPILVTPVGKRFFVVDGHHRLGAYQAAGWDKPIPVEVFSGDLREGREEALRRNIKNKLPMTQNSKLEMAWEFVKLGPQVYSKAHIVELTTISDGTVATMRRILKEHGSEVADLPWHQARSKQWGTQEEADADWREQKARGLAERLRTSGLGSELVKYPDIFALAVEMIDPELPEKLCSEWIEAAREVVRIDHELGI